MPRNFAARDEICECIPGGLGQTRTLSQREGALGMECSGKLSPQPGLYFADG
jgi:hypothetical protein